MRTPSIKPLALVLALLAGSPALAQAPLPAAPRSDLVGVYQEALRNNADLAAARAEYEAIAQGVPQARAGLLPQLNGGAELSDSETELNEPSASLQRSGTVWQVSLSQALLRADRWFQLRAARAVDRQAALQLAAAEQNILLQSAELYFAVLRAQDFLAASKAEEAALRRQLDEAQERFDVGLSNLTELLEAQASHDIAYANRQLAERQVADAFQALEAFTHRRYPHIDGLRHGIPNVAPAPVDPTAWVDTALATNLQLKAAAEGVTSAEETLRQRRAGHSPTVDLVAQYQRGDNDALGYVNSPLTASIAAIPAYRGPVERSSIGLQLNIPLYSGGLTGAQVRESYHRLDQSERQREALRRQVIQQTRDYHRAVLTDVEQVQARRQAVVSSQSALEATTVGYEIGSRNIVDVLDAQRQLYSAVRTYNDARYDYLLDHLRLKQVAGVLSPADLNDLAGFLKPDYDPDRDFLPADVKDSARLGLDELR